MKLKLAGHETFYPRDHWLYKGLNEKDAKISKKIKLSRTAGIKTIQFFGLTKNDLLSEIYSSEKQTNFLD